MGKLVDETESLNHRAALQQAALILAERIEAIRAKPPGSPGTGTLAQDMAQYRSTMAELRALPGVAGVAPKGGGKVVSADEARLRREARRAEAEAGAVPKAPARKRRG